MIATLRGEIGEKFGDLVVLEVHDVGYRLFVTAEDADHMVIGEKVKLYVFEYIRENSYDLYGFQVLEAKIMFEMLMTVNGVGPKMALAVMSLGNLAAIRGAIANGDTRFLQSASGVGKRVAERMVVDLKDRVGVLASAEATGFLKASPSSDEAVQALMALGFTATDAGEALTKVDKSLPLEDRIRLALKER
jgi:Holliday junction DNA helicase RuvA